MIPVNQWAFSIFHFNQWAFSIRQHVVTRVHDIINHNVETAEDVTTPTTAALMLAFALSLSFPSKYVFLLRNLVIFCISTFLLFFTKFNWMRLLFYFILYSLWHWGADEVCTLWRNSKYLFRLRIQRKCDNWRCVSSVCFIVGTWFCAWPVS